MGKIDLFVILTESKQMTYAKFELFGIELFDQLTVYKQITDVLLNC